MKLLILVLLFMLTVEDAFAYLDPGSGSLLLQLIAAGILGGLYALKTSWRSVIMRLRGRRAEKISEPPRERGEGTAA